MRDVVGGGSCAFPNLSLSSRPHFMSFSIAYHSLNRWHWSKTILATVGVVYFVLTLRFRLAGPMTAHASTHSRCSSYYRRARFRSRASSVSVTMPSSAYRSVYSSAIRQQLPPIFSFNIAGLKDRTWVSSAPSSPGRNCPNVSWSALLLNALHSKSSLVRRHKFFVAN